MSPNGSDRLDRIERSLERLAENDARLQEADARLREADERLQKNQAKASANLDRLIGVVDILVERGSRTERALESFISVTETKMKSLEEAQEQTQQNMNALIKIVDEMIRNRPPN